MEAHFGKVSLGGGGGALSRPTLPHTREEQVAPTLRAEATVRDAFDTSKAIL